MLKCILVSTCYEYFFTNFVYGHTFKKYILIPFYTITHENYGCDSHVENNFVNMVSLW